MGTQFRTFQFALNAAAEETSKTESATPIMEKNSVIYAATAATGFHRYLKI